MYTNISPLFIRHSLPYSYKPYEPDKSKFVALYSQIFGSGAFERYKMNLALQKFAYFPSFHEIAEELKKLSLKGTYSITSPRIRIHKKNFPESEKMVKAFKFILHDIAEKKRKIPLKEDYPISSPKIRLEKKEYALYEELEEDIETLAVFLECEKRREEEIVTERELDSRLEYFCRLLELYYGNISPKDMLEDSIIRGYENNPEIIEKDINRFVKAISEGKIPKNYKEDIAEAEAIIWAKRIIPFYENQWRRSGLVFTDEMRRNYIQAKKRAILETL